MPVKRRNRLAPTARFPRGEWERKYKADLEPRIKVNIRASVSALYNGGYIKRFQKYLIDTYQLGKLAPDALVKTDFDREADKLTFDRMTQRVRLAYSIDITDIIDDNTPLLFQAGSKFGFAKLGVDALWKIDSAEVRQAVANRLNLTRSVSDTIFDEVLDTIRVSVYEHGTGPVDSDLLTQIQQKAGLKARFQAERIARTEVLAVQSEGANTAWQQNGVTAKQWIAHLDTETRDAHAAVNGEIVPMDKPFSLGLMFPGADGPASLVVNCRCSHAPIYDESLIDNLQVNGVRTGA